MGLPLSGSIVPIIPWHYMELSGQLQAPAFLMPGKECPITHRIVGLVGPRAGLDGLGKSKLMAPQTVEHQIPVPMPCSLSCIAFWCLLQVCMSDDTKLPSRCQWTCQNWPVVFQNLYRYLHRPVVSNMWSRYPKGCMTSSRGIHGHIYLKATL